MKALLDEYTRQWVGEAKPAINLHLEPMLAQSRLTAEHRPVMRRLIGLPDPPPLPWHRRLKRAIYRWLIRFSDDGED